MNYLIVGLGNIGYEYVHTRHNIGFSVLDAWAQASNILFESGRYGSTAVVRFKGRTFHLLKPSTYMNLSGKAVNYWAQSLKIPLENILVIVDDMALPFGSIRIRKKGSDGGHNGLKSIIAELGSANFMRLRIGIGRPEPGKTVDYVLTGFAGEELTQFNESISTAAEAVRCALSAGLANAMNRYNAARVEPAVAAIEKNKEN